MVDKVEKNSEYHTLKLVPRLVPFFLLNSWVGGNSLETYRQPWMSERRKKSKEKWLF